ncbi:hypothetical protein CPC16_004351 [Podila verticillata]|nr:hypothetical protein CPC16_004351 [Podila verticillata]
MQLLLRSVPADTCSGLVKAAYEHDLLDAPPQQWRIDHLSFVRHFQSQDLSRDSLLVLTSVGTPLPPQMMEYIEAQFARKVRCVRREWQRRYDLKEAEPITEVVSRTLGAIKTRDSKRSMRENWRRPSYYAKGNRIPPPGAPIGDVAEVSTAKAQQKKGEEEQEPNIEC